MLKRLQKRKFQRKKTSTNSKTTTPWTFPKHPLEDALLIPKAIEEKNGGNPMKADMLAKAVGYNQSNDWRFKDLLRSANQYGLVEGSGAKVTVKLEQIGSDIVAPRSIDQRKKALLQAFENVDVFKGVEEYYQGKPIPEDEFFINTLTIEFKVPRDRTNTFTEIFLANRNFLKSFDVSKEVLNSAANPRTTSNLEDHTRQQQRKREYLETCFVMMPFGKWFDKYYKEIYIPAIKDAGFEPIRADELYSSGSVVEQIWEQIEKSKVLLADLTDRNPNVFYELGLAHCDRKPVVFTAANIEDVPFDLRHLRVITYEIREPDWASKLKNSITDYLRNAVKEPEKSIPHPFRKTFDNNS